MTSPPSIAAETPPSWRWPVLLLLATLAAFLPTLSAGFVHWDDPANFTDNRNFGGLSLAGIRWAWSAYQIGVYQPLAWMILEAEFSLWGLNPTGYHATGLAMHAVNAVVLYVLIRSLLERAAPAESTGAVRHAAAALAAAVFAIHPLRAEVVAWVSCQPYLSAVFFAMLSVLAYLRAHPQDGPPRRGWIVAAWLLMVAAMLCKAVAATLPVVLILLDVYPLRRIRHGRWVRWEMLAFLAPGFVFMALALRAKGVDQVIVPVSHYSPQHRLAQSAYGVMFYLGKTVWPSSLSAVYPVPPDIDLWAWPYSGAALAVVAITAMALVFCRRWPGLLAAWGAYLVILAPNLGLVTIGSQIAADRYSYMASIPLAAGAAWIFARLFRAVGASQSLRIVTVAAALAWLAVMGVLAWQQSRTWQTSLALWSNAARMTPVPNGMIESGLGGALIEAGRPDEGVAVLRKLLGWRPDYSVAHYELGVYYAERDRLLEAERHFRAALRPSPNVAPQPAVVHYNLGCVLEQTGRFDEAIAEYRTALLADPTDPAIHNNLGAVLIRLGRYRDAELCFEQALRLNPGYDLARRGRDYARKMQNSEPRPGGS